MRWMALLLLACSDQSITIHKIPSDTGAPEPDTGPPPEDTGTDGGTGGDGGGGDGGGGVEGGGDGAEGGDTAVEACPLLVPDHVDLEEVVWGEEGVHFYVPEPRWAFAAAHASRMTEDLGTLELRLPPAYFFATALKESFMGCSASIPADALHPEEAFARQVAADTDGCYQIESTTAWVEVCRLYSDIVDCENIGHADVVSSANQESTGRDNVETGAHVKVLYDLFGYAMLTTHGLEDPDAWLEEASDPWAMIKMVALVYNRGAWSGEVDAVVAGCAEAPLEDCVSEASIAQDYVIAVGSYTAQLHEAALAGQCYDAEVTVEQAGDYAASLGLLYGLSEAALRAEAEAAFLEASAGAERAPFQRVGVAVLDAISGAMGLVLECPEEALGEWYGVDCPT